MSNQNGNETMQNQGPYSLADLYNASRSLNLANTPGELLYALIDPMIPYGAIYATLFDVELGEDGEPAFLIHREAWDKSEVYPVANGTRFDLTTYSRLEQVEKGLVQLIGDIENSPYLNDATKQIYKQLGFGAFAALPLKIGEKWVGFATVAWEKAYDFSESDQQFFQSMADQAASTLQNLLLLEQSSRVSQELEYIKEAIDSSQEPVTIADARQDDFPLIYVNDAFERVTGYSREEVINRNCRFLQGPDKDQPGLKTLREALKNGAGCQVELRNYRKDGSLFINQLTISPIKNERGEITHFLGSQRDITESEKQTEALREAEKLQTDAAAQASRLYEASSQLNKAQNAQELLVSFLQPFIPQGVKNASLYSMELDEKGEPKYIVQQESWDVSGEPLIPNGTRFDLDVYGRLERATNGFVELIGDIQNSPKLEEPTKQIFGQFGLEAFAAVPLKLGPQWIGYMTVSWSDKQPFGPNDERFLQSMADQSAVVLNGINLLEKTQETVLETIQLYDTSRQINLASTTQALMEAFLAPMVETGAAYGSLFTVETDEQNKPVAIEQLNAWIISGELPIPNGTRFDLADFVGASEWAESGKMQLIEDIPNDPTVNDAAKEVYKTVGAAATGTFPLKIGQKWVGLVSVNWPQAQSFTGEDRRFFTSLTDQTAVALNSMTLQRETEARAEETAQLYEVSSQINLASNPVELLEAFLAPQLGSGPSDSAIFQVEIDDHNVPEAIILSGAWNHTGQNPFPPGTRFTMAEFPGLGQWALTGEILLISDLVNDPEVDENAKALNRNLGIAAQAYYPLKMGKKWVGVIMISWPEPQQFDGADIRLLQSLTDQTAVAFNSMALQRETEARAQENEQLFEVGRLINLAQTPYELLKGVLTPLFPEDILSGALFSMETDENNTPIAITQLTSWSENNAKPIPDGARFELANFAGSTNWVETSKPHAIGDIENDPQMNEASKAVFKQVGAKATATYPLKSGDTWVGAVNVNWAEAHIFEDREMQLMQAVSDQTAVALNSYFQQQESAQRAEELERVAEISIAIATLNDPQEMLQLAVDQAKTAFDLYHSHIYLLDDDSQMLRLTAGAGDIGRQMVQEGRIITLSAEQSLVAEAARSKQGVFENDVLSNENFLPHRLLPDTRSEMAIPIIVGSQVLGVLDVQRSFVGGFTQEDINIQTTLAAQLATALENAQQFNELQRQEEDLESLLENSPEAIGVLNVQTGFYEGVNRQAEILFGLSREELAKVGPLDVSPEFQPNGQPSGELAGPYIEQALKGERPTFEWTIRHSDGREIPTEIRMVGLGGERSHLIRFSTTDISDRLAAQKALRDSQTLFDKLTESVPGFLYQFDMNPAGEVKFPYGSRWIEDVFEISPEKLAEDATPLIAAIHPDDLEEFNQSVAHSAETMTPWTWTGRFKLPSDEYVYMKAESTPELLDGNVIRWSGVLTDIDEQVALEQAAANRAAQLAIVSEISAAVATAHDPNEMLQTLSDLTQQRFGHYHAHVYMVHEGEGLLKLTAGAGETGRQMVAEQRSISLSAQQSLVAQAVRGGQGVIENDVQANPAFLPHPLLKETRSEMAIPLIVGGKTLGVLDIQGSKTGEFNQESVSIFTTLASQAAVSIQNARSVEAAEKAAEELATVNRRLAREGWGSYVQQKEENLAFTFEQGTVQPLAEAKAKNGHHTDRLGHKLAEPLRVLNEPIGNLTLADPEELNEDAKSIIAEVAERLSAHIENLRLNEQTSQALSETETLYRLGDEINQSQSVQEVVDVIGRTVKVTGAHHVSYYSFEGASAGRPIWQELQATWQASPKEAIFPIGSRFKISNYKIFEFILGRNAEIALINNLASDSRTQDDKNLRSILSENNTQAAAFMPLILGPRVIGLITIEWPETQSFSEQEARFYGAMTTQVATAIDSLKLLEDAQSRATELAALSDLQGRLSTATNEDEIVSAVGETFEEADIGLHYLTTDYRDQPLTIQTTSMWGNKRVLTENPMVGQVIDIDHFATAKLWLSNPRAVVHFANLFMDERVDQVSREAAKAVGYHATSIVPLRSGGRWQAVLSLSWREEHELTSVEQNILQSLIEPLGAFVSSRRAQIAQEVARAEAETLYSAGNQLLRASEPEQLLQTLVENTALSNAFRGTLIYFNEEWIGDEKPEHGEILSVWQADGEIAGAQPGYKYIIPQLPFVDHFERDRILVFDDIQNNPLAGDELRQIMKQYGTVETIIAPIVAFGRWVGVITFQSKVPLNLEESDLRQIKSLTDQASIVLENRRLIDFNQKQAQKERVLREVAEKVRNAPTVDLVLKTAASEVGRVFGRKAMIYFNQTVEAQADQPQNGHD
ncbi:MAG: GAF domain-containing protein [Ardenticatenaceae bacterium]|nr:GAF domain-containing protein [Ardenticatenaceae bacterium]